MINLLRYPEFNSTSIELSTSEQTKTIIYSVTATDNVGVSSVSILGPRKLVKMEFYSVKHLITIITFMEIQELIELLRLQILRGCCI